MQIIEINAIPNGAHNNQMIKGVDPLSFPVPGGWAIVPDDLEIPDTFPFVDIEVSELGGVMTVTSMVAGIVPELPPDPKPEPGPTLEERVRTMEQSKANQADVDELNEALNMILTGATR